MSALYQINGVTVRFAQPGETLQAATLGVLSHLQRHEKLDSLDKTAVLAQAKNTHDLNTAFLQDPNRSTLFSVIPPFETSLPVFGNFQDQLSGHVHYTMHSNRLTIDLIETVKSPYPSGTILLASMVHQAGHSGVKEILLTPQSETALKWYSGYGFEFIANSYDMKLPRKRFDASLKSMKKKTGFPFR